MAKLIPTPKNAIYLPDTGDIESLPIKIAFSAVKQSIIGLNKKDHSEEFLKFIQTDQFSKIFERRVWRFIRKNFAEEQMVRDVSTGKPTDSNMEFSSKKYYILPSEIPGNRLLEVDVQQALGNEFYTTMAGSLGYFKVIKSEEGNKVKVVDGFDEGNTTCGYVVENNRLVPVLKEESLEITNSCFVFLELGNKTFKTINLPMPLSTDLNGLRLIARVKLDSIDGDNVLSIDREHIGLIYNNFASEPFDIMLTSASTILLKGGSFGVDNHIESIADTSFTVTETAPLYIETDGGGEPEALLQSTPEFDPLIARTPIGRVYFDDGKITRIEPYVRGWFHCHTWRNCTR